MTSHNNGSGMLQRTKIVSEARNHHSESIDVVVSLMLFSGGKMLYAAQSRCASQATRQPPTYLTSVPK